MSNKFTADATIIAAAHNFCIAEINVGREPVFTVLAVGMDTTWRQRRLFESAMTEYLTRRYPELNDMAKHNIEQYRAI